MSVDSDEEEDYATYGTPLEPIEEDAVPSKRPVSIEDQVVLDKQGRRRFHGAFTGGFSAGYCNTVGSQEGWTPSTFKSSRSEKAGQRSQKPEDFMDEEDKSEFGIAPKVLRATADYKQNAGFKRAYPRASVGPIPGRPVLQDILQPVRETVGVRLLQQMGWRPGQGVGPRLSREQKKRQQHDIQRAGKKVYGCVPQASSSADRCGSDNSAGESENEDLSEVTFAPDDYAAFLVKPKDDCFGIGYKGLDRQPVLSGHVQLFEPSFLGMEEKKKKVSIWGQAFGVGALEDDDEDIYAKDDMSRYDFALESSATLAQQRREEKERDRRGLLALTSYGQNGAPLEGFVLGKKQLVSRKKFFPPPTLPAGFKAQHTVRTRWSQSSQDQESDSNSAKRKGLHRHDLGASVRASILDEPISKPSNPPPSTSGALNTSSTVLGFEASSMFRPFATEPEKQVRYEKFLELAKSGQKDQLSAIQPALMTEWDKEHERSEFEQAARLYKPLSGIMSDRFVSATQSDDALNPLKPVERMRHGNEEQQNAAKMKMFGKLTRSQSHWQPSALLCKRFNVPQPTGIPEVPNSRRSLARFSVFDFLDASGHNNPTPAREMEQTVVKSEPSQTSCVDTQETVPVKYATEPSSPVKSSSGIANTLARLLADDSGKEQPNPDEKPDLFKAIFLSSSDESDSEDEEEKDKAAEKESQTLYQARSDQSKNNVASVLRNMSPPRGIFANLDLDSLNACKTIKSEPAEEAEVARSVVTVTREENDPSTHAELMYGPQLPSSFTKSSSSSTTCTTALPIPSSNEKSSGQWVERSSKNSKTDKHQNSGSPSEDSDESSDSDVEREKLPTKRSSSAKKSKKTDKHRKHKKVKKHKKHKSKTKHKKKSRD